MSPGASIGPPFCPWSFEIQMLAFTEYFGDAIFDPVDRGPPGLDTGSAPVGKDNQLGAAVLRIRVADHVFHRLKFIDEFPHGLGRDIRPAREVAEPRPFWFDL